MASGQSVNVSTSVSTPLSSDLSKPTSIFNSASIVSIGTASSSSTPNSTSVDSFRTGSSSSILNPTSVVSFSISSSSMASFVPTFSASTAPTSQVLSSTASSLPENGFSSSPLSKSFQSSLPSSPPTSPSASKSESTSRSTASKTAGSSVHHSSEPGSTTTSVIVATSSWKETSTFTTRPTSTLSTRVVLTTTNSIGSLVATTPPLVTIWSTSTDSNGTLVTATAVVANAPQTDLTILHNTGAVAGIFSVVGVVFASLVACMVICIRRRRKTRQREKWLSGMRAQQPRSFSDDPFRDDSLLPAMHTVNTDTEVDPWDRKGFLTPENSNHGHMTFGQTKASVFPVYPTSKNGTFSHPEIHQQTIDMESPTESSRARHSLAPSTPSIYPVSVEDEDKDLIIVPYFNQSATGSNLPPRPPRSHLRRSVKVYGSGLPTPPESSEHSNYTNIVSEPRSLDYVHILDRKTILDVQSRLIT